jgi:hypothetical protein
MVRLIGADSLEADAVVPQCLDNQFVSDRLFRDMMLRGVDFSDPEIVEAREQDFKTEFIRSLVYSSQVIVQRAFFRNSKFLYRYYQPHDVKNLQAFAKLMNEGAIVPYLFKESSLRDNLDFGLSSEGDLAMQNLLGEVGDDLVCVRLAVSDQANGKRADAMATDFGNKLTRYASMNPGGAERLAVANELFISPEPLHVPGAPERFDEAMVELAVYALQAPQRLKRTVSRQDVYRDNFAAEQRDENVVLGRYKRPSRDMPFLLELKKYVDLVYNSNLPDRLERYTFTPANMPSRTALQDAPGEGYEHDDIAGALANPDVLEHLRRTFLAHTHKAMTLPILADLTIEDVWAIRRLPEWEAFKEAQTSILKNPLRCLETVEPFEAAFNAFQAALSSWYYAKYKRAQTEAKYCSFVSFALSIGGKLILAGSHLDPHLKIAAQAGADTLVPKSVKGYVAKLLVGVYDIEKKKLDAQRSYTVELMQTATELTREDVTDLIQSLSRNGTDEAPSDASGVADQGIQ